MLDFAWSHFFLFFLVALLFLGPKELPIILKYFGKIFVKMKRQREELNNYLNSILSPIEETEKKHESSLPLKDKNF